MKLCIAASAESHSDPISDTIRTGPPSELTTVSIPPSGAAPIIGSHAEEDGRDDGRAWAVTLSSGTESRSLIVRIAEERSPFWGRQEMEYVRGFVCGAQEVLGHPEGPAGPWCYGLQQSPERCRVVARRWVCERLRPDGPDFRFASAWDVEGADETETCEWDRARWSLGVRGCAYRVDAEVVLFGAADTDE